MDNFKIANEWFEIAEKDLSSAKYLQNMRPTPIEIICYHCQQSSEKYLKGFLALNGREIIKTHDLIAINKLCVKLDGEFEKISGECLRLTDYGSNIRYPYPLELNVSDMKLALEDAEKIRNFVVKKISAIKKKMGNRKT